MGFVLTGPYAAGRDLPIKPKEAYSDPRQVLLADAADAGNIGSIERAIGQGADVNAVGRSKVTPLWYALAARKKRAFVRLLDLGANPNVVDENGEPLIGHCVAIKDSGFLKFALAQGADPNARNSQNGMPVIFRAVSADSNDKLDLLFSAGGDVNLRRGDGSTAIVYASSARQMAKVLYLLKRGADPFIKNQVGNDIAAGLFGPNWATKGSVYEARNAVLKLLEPRGTKPDPAVIEKADIRNFDEACGREPPKWLKADRKEPNPLWVKRNPEEAKRWYEAVLSRPLPVY